MRNRRKIAAIVIAVLIITLGIALLAIPGPIRALTQYDALTGGAEALLDDSIDQNMFTFAGVSSVKAVIALVEGSSVGVGFDLEVGDLVQPAYDYIDFIWRIFLYALLLLTFYKLLMETGLLGLGFTLMGVGLILGGIAVLTGKGLLPVRRWARLFIVVGVMISYLLPGALLATEAVSNTYLVNVKAANSGRIQGVQDDFTQAREDILNLREQVSLLSPGQSFETIRAEALEITTTLTDSIWDSVYAFLTFVLILMVEALLLPFLTAFVLYKAFLLAVRKVERRVMETAETREESRFPEQKRV